MKKSTSQPLALVIILLISSSSLRFSTHGALDTINQTQSIKDGETLVSRSDFYVLEFFEDWNDRSSPKKKYLGISNNSTRRLVWTANGENPITDGTGVLHLTSDGNLIILQNISLLVETLDNTMNPKIAYFGTARLFGSDQMEDNTMRVIGTYGYMSPEYAMNGIFSMKSDVFSFGILLLEIISGKKNRVLYQLNLDFNLLDLSSGPFKDGNILELLDETLHYSCSITQVLHFIKIGLLCVQDVANDRPSMFDVVFMLSNENSHVPEAKRPRFFVGHMSNEVINENRQVTDTVNELSFTNLEVH